MYIFIYWNIPFFICILILIMLCIFYRLPKRLKPRYIDSIITSPSDIGERDITDEQGKIFEETLGRAILEIIEDQHIGSDEDINNNIKESITK